ncbi:Permease of the drug/metabolite transporter (DMT) superfamily [hydrothermal vent metagenome]|uniref:Permease of the drug/metabolite transporter (DMT) superfamily n=1 Tax=hydrothermal vent metagenome TaxID=652676 RepID=A0A3B0U6G0_9ZZZZ
MEKLQWTKDIFGSKLDIKLGSETIGNIQWGNMLSPKAQAIINGKLFTLNREFFLSKIEIFDANDHSLLGVVIINLFNPKSDVVINGKRFELEIKNFWQSQWSWKFNGVEMIRYTSNEFILKEKGDIELFTAWNEEVEILLLLGLFVRNQFILFMLFMLTILIVIIL